MIAGPNPPRWSNGARSDTDWPVWRSVYPSHPDMMHTTSLDGWHYVVLHDDRSPNYALRYWNGTKWVTIDETSHAKRRDVWMTRLPQVLVELML